MILSPLITPSADPLSALLLPIRRAWRVGARSGSADRSRPAAPKNLTDMAHPRLRRGQDIRANPENG